MSRSNLEHLVTHTMQVWLLADFVGRHASQQSTFQGAERFSEQSSPWCLLSRRGPMHEVLLCPAHAYSKPSCLNEHAKMDTNAYIVCQVYHIWTSSMLQAFSGVTVVE